jgi:hypothetical protein
MTILHATAPLFDEEVRQLRAELDIGVSPQAEDHA